MRPKKPHKTQSKIEFTNVTSKHQDDVCQIYQEFIDTTHSTQPKDLKKNFNVFLEEENGYITLAYFNKKLAGFAEYRPLPKKLRDSNQKIEITSLFVRPQFQKRSIGRALIQHIRNFAEETGRDRVVLYSGLELTEAHIFYRKVGFTKNAFFFELKVSKEEKN